MQIRHDVQALIHRLRKVMDEYEAPEQKLFSEWITQLDELDALRALSEHFIIKDKIKGFNDQVEALNQSLLNTPDLEKEQRNVLLARRNFYLDEIRSYDAESRIDEIAQTIVAELEDNSSNEEEYDKSNARG